MFEKKRTAAIGLLADPIGDGGDLQQGVGLDPDAAQLVVGFEKGDEVVEVFNDGRS